MAWACEPGDVIIIIIREKAMHKVLATEPPRRAAPILLGASPLNLTDPPPKRLLSCEKHRLLHGLEWP